MTVAEFVGRLAAQGAWLSAEEDGIRYQGPRRLLTEQLRSYVGAHRRELIDFLRRTADEMTVEELDALGHRWPEQRPHDLPGDGA